MGLRKEDDFYEEEKFNPSNSVYSGGIYVFRGGIQVGEAATEYTSTITSNITLNNGDSVNVTTQNSGANIDPTQKNSAAIDTTKNNISIIANSEIPITVTASKDYTAGIKINGFHKLETSGSGKLKFNIFANQTGYGIWINSGYNSSDPNSITTHFNTDLDINMQKNPSYTSKLSHLAAIRNEVSNAKNIFDGNVSIDINADNASLLAGIENMEGIMVFNKSVEINTSGQDSTCYGVLSQDNAFTQFTGDVIINTGEEGTVAENTYSSKLIIGKNADSTSENNAVKVNITGNIETAVNSQTLINASSSSLINGSIIDYTDYDSNGVPTSTTLALHNGATWNNTGESNLTNLVMNNGVLKQDSDKDISIANYSGTGKVLIFAEPNANNSGVVQINKGDITIGKAAANSVLNADLANNNKINSIDNNKAEENLNAIAKKITYTANDGKLTGTVKLQEGLITPAVSADLNFDANNQGYVSNVFVDTRDTDTMNAMRHIGAASIISWRQEDSTLGQRLGALRESKDDGGIWVRMNRGKYEYAGALNGQYNFFQMGYDKAFGSWHYGAAVSHNDGKTTYTNGKGNNDSTSLALYGTWLGNAGHYADIVLKEGRLSTDYDIYAPAGYTHGKYNNWGTSISGEYGRKIAFKDFYLTPQAQLTFMRIDGKNYTTANNIHVEQDNLYSTVGRIGVEIGKNIADKGTAYLRTSLLHEFAGDADTHLTLNGISNSYTQDIGNTWYELGVGFNYQTATNSYLYADIAKTFGDDYRTPWQWNVGMRWAF